MITLTKKEAVILLSKQILKFMISENLWEFIRDGISPVSKYTEQELVNTLNEYGEDENDKNNKYQIEYWRELKCEEIIQEGDEVFIPILKDYSKVQNSSNFTNETIGTEIDEYSLPVRRKEIAK